MNEHVMVYVDMYWYALTCTAMNEYVLGINLFLPMKYCHTQLVAEQSLHDNICMRKHLSFMLITTGNH